MVQSSIVFVLLVFVSISTAFCPLYGPVFPAPTNLAAASTIKDALEKLTTTYDDALRGGNGSTAAGPNSGVRAVQIFSLDSDDSVYEYYYDGTILSNTTGVKHMDGNAIVRVGSLSKLITTYLLLKEVGDGAWDLRVTDVIPELKGNEKWKEDELAFTKWQEVTLGTLAGQISGVVVNFIAIEGFNLLGNPLADPSVAAGQLGLPPLEPSEEPACVLEVNTQTGITCTRAEFFAALDTRQPVFRPNTQPMYSNTPFLILGYALESITGRRLKDILQSLIDTLNLTATSINPPDPSRGAILYNLTRSDFNRSMGDAAPIGGLFSSLNDLAKIGRSILRSTVIDANSTRAWLKPTSFTSDLRSAVGRPWEIYRFDTKSSRGVIDIFGKGGDYGIYHLWFGIVPDYDIGFVVAVGGEGDKDWLSKQIVDIVFPALEEEARKQADIAYAGTYTATNGLNSTLTLTTEAGKPGLGVVQWISNGTDVLEGLSQVFGDTITNENFRFLPTNLRREVEGGGAEIAWRALRSTEDPNTKPSAFDACQSWFIADNPPYGHASLDEVFFTLGVDGKAIIARPNAYKVDLKRST